MEESVKKKKRKAADAVSPTKNYLELLPTEVLLKIFHYYVKTESIFGLKKVIACVSRRWKAIAMDTVLWKVIELPECDERDKEIFMNLCRCGALRKTTELDLKKLRGLLKAKEVSEICSFCPDLRSLNFSHTSTPMKKVICQSIIQDCSGLCRLGISNVGMMNIQWLGDLFTKRGQNLLQLSVTETCFPSSNTLMLSIASYCPNIQELDLSNLEGCALCFPVESLQEKCPAIRVLRLANTVFSIKSESKLKIEMSPGFQNLEEISLAAVGTGFSCVSEDAFWRILSKSSRLKLLDIRGCTKLGPELVARLPTTVLEHIFISRTTLQLMGDPRIMIKYRHSLRELDLSWHPCLESLTCVLSKLSDAGSSRLEILDLTGSTVTLPVVKFILDNLVMLQTLNLESCRSLGRGWKRRYGKDELKELRQRIEHLS